MIRQGDVSEYDCGLYEFGLGLTTLVGTLTKWFFVDVPVSDASCVEIVDSGVIYSLVLFSFV